LPHSFAAPPNLFFPTRRDAAVTDAFVAGRAAARRGDGGAGGGVGGGVGGDVRVGGVVRAPAGGRPATRGDPSVVSRARAIPPPGHAIRRRERRGGHRADEGVCQVRSAQQQQPAVLGPGGVRQQRVAAEVRGAGEPNRQLQQQLPQPAAHGQRQGDGGGDHRVRGALRAGAARAQEGPVPSQPVWRRGAGLLPAAVHRLHSPRAA
ncbi:hypothetical protein CLOM_g12347, partial [Closterium sp. NIES-68]